MKKSVIILFISLVSFTITLYGQATGEGRPNMANMPMDAKVFGAVTDATSNQPVEYASVAIYRVKDSSLVGGVVTDPSGKFNIGELPYGKFYATITFIGYKKLKIENILLIPNQKIKDLGTVKLETSTTALKEVEVIGNSNQVEYKIDKKVVNVSQNIMASGGTVVDALQNTPSVQTDVEGNVTLRGSSSFTVLIDGKPSVVQGSEALQQIPASLVQNIEIITNPSAKYDAEGSAGIINVIMKKQKIKGFNGTVSLSAGTNYKNNNNFLLNYRVNKFNFSIGADYTDMRFKMNSESHGLFYDNNAAVYKDQTMNASGQFRRGGTGARAAIDYTINDKSSISLGGRIGDRKFERPFNSVYTDYFPLGDSSIYYNSESLGKSDDNFYSLNLDYTLNLNSKGHQLLFAAYYSYSNENDPSETKQDTTDILREPNKEYLQNITEKGNEKEYRLKVDYTLPLGEKGKLEAGLQSRIENTFADRHIYFNKVEDITKLDKLNFDENIHSGYLTFSNSTKYFDFQLGMRAEYEKRLVSQKYLSKDTSVDRIDFFPTIHISKQLPWGLQMQASYRRSLSRPGGRDLNPLRRYMDPQRVRVGNPGLLPAFTDAYELSVQKKINEASFVNIEGFYRNTKNPMQMKIYVEDSLTIMTTENLGKEESLGVETMLNIGITKKWTFNTSASIYNYKLTGEMDNATSKTSTNWNIRGTTMYRFKTGTSLQINGMYNAPTITSQGTRGAFFTTGFAIRQDLLKNKASLTLQARDIIGEMKMKIISEDKSLYSYNVMKRETKVFTLTFTYRINNYKQQAKRNQEDSNGGGDMGGDMM